MILMNIAGYLWESKRGEKPHASNNVIGARRSYVFPLH